MFIKKVDDYFREGGINAEKRRIGDILYRETDDAIYIIDFVLRKLTSEDASPYQKKEAEAKSMIVLNALKDFLRKKEDFLGTEKTYKAWLSVSSIRVFLLQKKIRKIEDKIVGFPLLQKEVASLKRYISFVTNRG